MLILSMNCVSFFIRSLFPFLNFPKSTHDAPPWRWPWEQGEASWWCAPREPLRLAQGGPKSAGCQASIFFGENYL